MHVIRYNIALAASYKQHLCDARAGNAHGGNFAYRAGSPPRTRAAAKVFFVRARFSIMLVLILMLCMVLYTQHPHGHYYYYYYYYTVISNGLFMRAVPGPGNKKKGPLLDYEYGTAR
jgi:hypothetical protein